MPIDPPPVIVFLHWLGGSAESWSAVERALPPPLRALRLDLPGFGGADAASDHSVAAMADHVASAVARAGLRRWILAGHSMGAKVAMLLARRAQDGDPVLAGLRALVLVAGSPPAPEPMEDAKRREMLGWFAGGPERDRQQADGFVRDNLAAALDEDAHRGAVDEVLRVSPPAWRAWLTAGSLEDLAATIGTLALPALVLAGADDSALGAEAQRRLMLPHLPAGRLEIIAGAHLLPLEAPGAVAERIAALAASLDRITLRTRIAQEARARPPQGGVLPAELRAVLGDVLERVLPRHAAAIDLAGRVDAMLQEGTGDGWRFAVLPPDAEAYRAGLHTLRAAGFPDVDAAAQDAMLREVAEGRVGTNTPDGLDPERMALWFQDVCADATRLFVAHPATQALLGTDAVETGGDDRLRGFAPYRIEA